MATRQADGRSNRPSPEEWDDLCRDIGALWAAIDDITDARGAIAQSHDSLLTEFGELAQRVLRSSRRSGGQRHAGLVRQIHGKELMTRFRRVRFELHVCFGLAIDRRAVRRPRALRVFCRPPICLDRS